jgi:uncharacterized protein YegL
MRLSIATALLSALAGSALSDPGVSPASVSQAANPGSSFYVDKVVNTPEVPPKPDVVLLVDITGSMGGAIGNIKTNLASVISTVKASQPAAEFAVASFGDIEDFNPFQVIQGLTGDEAPLQAAVNSLAAGGGGDFPEDWINALYKLSTGDIAFRDGSSRVIVVVADAPSHDPSGGHTLNDAIAALQAKNIRVIAVDVGAINVDNQATAVTDATGGVIIGSAANTVSDAIVNGLKNLDVTVTPEVVSCDSGLTLAFAPAKATVPSGTAATFNETVTVAGDATQGATLHCAARFLLNGAPGGDAFTQSVAVKVNDVTPPSVSCADGPNPAGSTNPDKNANFWTLTAKDNVDAENDLAIIVRDSVSGVEFGPYAPGTTIKLVQAPGATPNVKPGTGEVDWKITVKGCAVLVVRDKAGNEATASCCARP